MFRNLLPSAVRVGIATVVMFAVFTNDALAQCDSGHPGESVDSCDPCNGSSTQVVFCEGNTQVRGDVICQDGGWKDVVGSWEDFKINAWGACAGTPANTPPICPPNYWPAFFFGIDSGKLVFKQSAADASFDGENCTWGVPDTTIHNSIPAQGCCAAVCQDQVACQAEPNRVYREHQDCSCVTVNCTGCDSEPPCTVDQILDEDCNCCRTPPEGSPIVLELGSNALRFSRPEDGVLFDLLAIGRDLRVSWPISGDAFWLALDRNGNGRIDDGSELFGTATRLKNGQLARHGYEALGEFDQNQDGRIDASDPIFHLLVLWQRSLPSAGDPPQERWIRLADSAVRSVSLDVSEIGRRDRWGNRFRFRAKVILAGNATRWSYDVFVVTVAADDESQASEPPRSLPGLVAWSLWLTTALVTAVLCGGLYRARRQPSDKAQQMDEE